MSVERLVYNNLAWINIEKPTSLEMHYLRESYPFFHPLDLEDCLSKIERPKIDEYHNYLFIVMHFPVFDKATRRLAPSQVSIFAGHDFVVTVSEGNLKPLVRDFAASQEDEEVRDDFMGRGSHHLVYRIVDGLVDHCFPMVDKENQNMERVEERIFDEDARKTLREISIIRRNLINFRRIIKPQMGILAQLERKEWEFLKGDMDIYWGDISDHTAQIWDRLEDLWEVVEGLGDTVDSLTSHGLNEVMKILAIIAISFGSVEAVSGIFGMNLPMPWAQGPHLLPIVTSAMILVVMGMWAYFRRIGWL